MVERTEFPVFAVGFMPDIGVVLCAGGGGNTKSGVPNGLAAYRFDAGSASLKRLGFLSTGQKAVMSLAVHPRETSAILGVGERCWLVNVDWDKKAHPEGPGEEVFLGLTKALRSDYSSDSLPEEERGYQKCCKFDASGLLLATGGVDSVGRLWEYPSLTSLETFEPENGEQANTDGGQVQSVDILDDYMLVVRERQVCLHDFDAGADAKGMLKCPRGGDGFRTGCFVHVDRVLLTQDDHFDLRDLEALASGAVAQRSLGKRRRITAVSCAMNQDPIHTLYGLVAFGCSDGSVGMLRCGRSSLKVLKMWPQLHPFSVSSVHMTFVDASAVYIASGSVGGTVSVQTFSGSGRSSSSRALFVLCLTMLLCVLIGYLYQQWLVYL